MFACVGVHVANPQPDTGKLPNGKSPVESVVFGDLFKIDLMSLEAEVKGEFSHCSEIVTEKPCHFHESYPKLESFLFLY